MKLSSNGFVLCGAGIRVHSRHAHPRFLPRHMTDRVKKALVDSGCELVITPGGLTPIFQPLDMALNKAFKDRIGTFYNEWLQQENPDTDRAAEARFSERSGAMGQ